MPKSSKREQWNKLSLAYMKKYPSFIYFLGLSLLLGMFSSCKRTDPEFTEGSVQLRFSEDTVYFDTLLSTVKSTTKRLRVYNDASKAVSISTIGITNTSNAFSLTVNGIEGNAFENTDLLAGDSLLILLNATLEDQNENLPYVVEETLSFTTNGAEQTVPVIAWGQDAHFLRDSVLVCNSVWTAGKPYVIYDDILVDSLCSLTIEPGTRVYSHFGSTIYVQGTLLANGTAQSPIEFTNDRFDSGFDTAPGQWNGIVFLEGSKSNQITFATIKNAHNAIWLGTPDNDTLPNLTLANTIIENNTGSGILTFTSDLSMTNCLVDNCGEFVLACLAGGNIQIVHSTLTNYGLGFFRTQPIAVFTNNLQLNDGSVLLGDLSVEMENSIVWGTQTDELAFNDSGDKSFNISISNNLIRTSDSNISNQNIVNQDPIFIAPYEFNYRIDTLSPAIDKGVDLGISIDLDSLQRDNKPDLGAYEWKQN
ncbi:MAG: right-handed parallel beta-helix repeat-containing protein [Cyclobacteriaceae bacterium]|nr:right-handed parallel beta-helix repeat-containing protein [Cyclobacteriaceae bacterium]